MSASSQPTFRIRSFVVRGGRGTSGQIRAMREVWPTVGLELAGGLVNFTVAFGREAPTFLEIGFGSGTTLLAAAADHPDKNFIGVETHRPGMGAMLMGMEEQALSNIRAFKVDVIDVLAECIPDNSLDGVQIFFPDPWQKRRHFERRLVQPDFLRTMARVLKAGGSLHLATDWEDYAKHMLRVVTDSSQFENVAGVNQYGSRSVFRPSISRFEQRALNEGRLIRELQLVKL